MNPDLIFGGILFGMFALPLICVAIFYILKSICFVLFIDIPLIIEAQMLKYKLEKQKHQDEKKSQEIIKKEKEKEVVSKWIQLMTL